MPRQSKFAIFYGKVTKNKLKCKIILGFFTQL